MSLAWRRSRYRRRRPRLATATAAAIAASAAVAVATTLLLLLPPPATALKVIFSNAIPDYPSPGPQYTLALPPPGGAVPPGARPLADADESVDVTLTTPTGQRMRCGVPVERPPGAESPAAAARRKRVAAGGGLFDGIDKLLSAYDGLCFLRLEGWWTYEFCYGSRLVQRHIPRDGEDDTTYVLGLAPPSLARFGGETSATATDGKPGGDESSTDGDAEVAASSTSPGSADSQPEQTAPPYVQVYNNGTLCDIASETPRQVTIRYLCATALHGPLATRVTPRGRAPRRAPPAAHPAAAGRVTGRRQARRRGRRLPTRSPRTTLPRCGSPRRASTSWIL
ncbi:hypothetical protein BU14_0065s0002 [Porphyra umbilicalis]|uniref:Protein OS9-like domain-containing protein n=1 Tax=Porphyra umbilicalis TaxID=2786 RepID=A0A1X6PGL6_PORUM|nr:hypothetical protein BU14_0065s0002 [Porphyra umbilicalis]|eukprot:OSX79997.1 hypothetical protein BU14_0065s0002 [Porphyra umbilicalis]